MPTPPGGGRRDQREESDVDDHPRPGQHQRRERQTDLRGVPQRARAAARIPPPGARHPREHQQRREFDHRIVVERTDQSVTHRARQHGGDGGGAQRLPATRQPRQQPVEGEDLEDSQHRRQ